MKKTNSLAIIACLVWSTAFVGVKIGLNYTTPLHLAGLRFAIAGIIILPFCKNHRRNFKVLWEYKWSVIKISFFSTFALYSLFHIGISIVPASITALIIGASPLFITILARIFNGEALTKRKVLAIFSGFLGIGIIALGRFGGLLSAEVSLVGIGILMLGSICGGMGNILVAKQKMKVSPVFLNAVQLTLGGIALLILSFCVERNQFAPKPYEYYLALGWLSLIGAIGFSLWFIVLKSPGVKVSEINIWKFIIPVLGAILSWVILPNEHPELIVIMGMILVGLALIIMFLKVRNPQKN